jgi:hypothetical protein
MDDHSVSRDMIEAGYAVIGPFNHDILDLNKKEKIDAMVAAIYVAMRAVHCGAPVTVGIQRGLALRSSQVVISPNQPRSDQGQ